jgi:hypothetical protein
MSKNLNLKVEDDIFFEFHRLKSLLRAGTNADALLKLLLIADEKIQAINQKTELDEYIRKINKKMDK